MRIGQTVDGYEIVEFLAEGSFGKVYRGRNMGGLGVDRAYKVPLDDRASKVLRTECEAWRAASGHPNVVPILDVVDVEGETAIVMEFIDGGALRNLIDKSPGGLGIERCLAIADDLLKGLVHLHSRGIVHGDLKPENVLMQGGSPRLSDFGISQLSTSEATDGVWGDPRYAAPEQYRGERSTFESDVWSFGVIFYEMSLGRLPFASADLQGLRQAILHHDPLPLDDSLPPIFQEVIDACLRKDPGARPTTEAILKRLRERGEEAVTVRERIVHVEQTRHAIPPWGYAAGAVLLLGSIAAGVWSMNRPAEVQVKEVIKERPPADPQLAIEEDVAEITQQIAYMDSRCKRIIQDFGEVAFLPKEKLDAGLTKLTAEAAGEQKEAQKVLNRALDARKGSIPIEYLTIAGIYSNIAILQAIRASGSEILGVDPAAAQTEAQISIRQSLDYLKRSDSVRQPGVNETDRSSRRRFIKDALDSARYLLER